MAKFVLLDEKLIIPDSYIRDYKLNMIRNDFNEKATTKFNIWYKKQSGIEDVLRNYTKIALDLIEEYALVPLFKSLNSFDIYDISEERYADLCLDYEMVDNVFENILAELEKIVNDQNEIKQYRAMRKAYRGRAVGGGFGISGAIKGAVKAGAVNATTGMVYGAVNVVGNLGSSIAASAKKMSLYNDEETKKLLSVGISLSIYQTYENHKRLINEYVNGYYESGFDKDKAETLFENAKKIPEKRKMLLVESIRNYPMEETLAYVFSHYKAERKRVYEIGKIFNVDLGKYIEEVFVKMYTSEVKKDEQKVADVKKEIITIMEEFNINSSKTLNHINYNELNRIVKKYMIATADVDISSILDDFNKYDASVSQKQQVVYEKGVWQLASRYSVTYDIKEVEAILKRYYTEEDKNSEAAAQESKKKIIEVMKALNIETAVTYDQLEKDCIARICENIENANEEICNTIRDRIVNYDALEKNKKEFLDKVQKRIEDIWSKEDGEIFDNVYLNTNIYNRKEIDSAIEFIKQKGRTVNAERYISALQACNAENIRKARKYQERNTKISNIIGMGLLIIGIWCFMEDSTWAIVAIPGIILKIRYWKMKKIWNILTIDGALLHKMIILSNLSKDSEKNK